MMKLIEPSMEYERQILDYRRAFLEAGSSMDGCGSLRRYETVRAWLDALEADKRSNALPGGQPGSVLYLFVREEDRAVVGMLQIRRLINETLKRYAGNVGYSVRPDERRKGYAVQMLAAALPLCRQMGLDRILISCRPENEGSRRTILRNGGVFESTVYWPERDVYLERYWIDLRDPPPSADPGKYR